MSTTELKNLIASLLIGHKVGSGVYQQKRYKATKKYPKNSVYPVRTRTLANKLPKFGVKNSLTVARMEQADPTVRRIRAIYTNPAYEQYYPELFKTMRAKTAKKKKPTKEQQRKRAEAKFQRAESERLEREEEEMDKPEIYNEIRESRTRNKLKVVPYVKKRTGEIMEVIRQSNPRIELLADGIRRRRRRVVKRSY